MSGLIFTDISQTIVSLGCVVIFLWFRRPAHDLFIKSHFALALLSAVSLWYHIPKDNKLLHLYLILAGASVVTSFSLKIVRGICRNSMSGRPSSRAFISKDSGAAVVTLYPGRPFHVHAGQFVYLWMPRVSLTSIFQVHLFAITAWEENLGGKATSLSFLIKARRGFTGKLLRGTTSRSNEYLAWIDGPYGSTFDLRRYRRVLMVATGIGIAAQLSYLQEMICGRKNGFLGIQSVLLQWEIEDLGRFSRNMWDLLTSLGAVDWVIKWMDQMLNDDAELYAIKI